MVIGAPAVTRHLVLWMPEGVADVRGGIGAVLNAPLRARREWRQAIDRHLHRIYLRIVGLTGRLNRHFATALRGTRENLAYTTRQEELDLIGFSNVPADVKKPVRPIYINRMKAGYPVRQDKVAGVARALNDHFEWGLDLAVETCR